MTRLGFGAARLLLPSLLLGSAAVGAAVESCPPPGFPLGAVSFGIAPGSADCGGAGLATPPSPPFSGELTDASGTTLADLGLGCFYLGGGRATNLPPARLPDGSTSLLDVATVNGLSLGLAASDGTGPANCTRGAGPLRHCVNGAPGTDGHGLCTTDADCGEGVGNCRPDANCLFGAPIPVPNPTPVLSACAVNVIASDPCGVANLLDGSASVSLALSARLYLTGDQASPCPRCVGGVCSGGARAGQPCAGGAGSAGTTHECLPDPTEFVGALDVSPLSLSTGTSVMTSPDGNFCAGQRTPGAFGTGIVAREITQRGTPLLGGPALFSTTLAGNFCVPASENALVDNLVDAPGPGSVSAPGTIGVCLLPSFCRDLCNPCRLGSLCALTCRPCVSCLPPTLPSVTSTTVPAPPPTTTLVVTTTTVPSTSSTVPAPTTTSTTVVGAPTTTTLGGECCNGEQFVGFSTVAAPGDCGDILNVNGNPFSARPDVQCGGLYFGGGGNSVPLPAIVPDLGQSITRITSCTGQTGTLGPTTAAETGTNRTCSAAGCLFGAPLPIPNTSSTPTSTCVINVVANDVSGTVDCATGAQEIDLPLSAEIYLTGDSLPLESGIQPCPLCTGGSPGAPGSGVCRGGSSDGNPCTPHSSDLGDPFPTSHDCPPLLGANIGALPIGFALTSGTVAYTAAPSGTQTRVFCGYCRDADETLAFQNPAVKCFENGASTAACADPFESCEQQSQGAFGPAGGNVQTVTAVGSAAGDLTDSSPHAATLVSVFCIPPTFNATVDAAANLPGPGAVALPGATELCTDAASCP
jgi:hypothetical protein